MQQRDLPAQYFGEGITIWKSTLLQLTWQSGIAFAYDRVTFAPRATFKYRGEGWGLTNVEANACGTASVAADSPGLDSASTLAVRAAVAALPERERRVVILRFFADLPVSEVAGVMQCPEGTVKSLTHAAITRLRAAGLEVSDD